MTQSAPVGEVPGVRQVFINLDIASNYEFPANQVYDEQGQVPTEGYDAEYVITSMKASSSKFTAIQDWALLDYDDVTIQVTVVHDDGRRSYAEW